MLKHLLKDSKQLTKTSPAGADAAGDYADSILVIDSGVGGLSVCQSILAKQPNLQIIYFADSAFFPYGLLPEEQLSERLKVIVRKMLALHHPKLVVLACNTVSTLVLPELRQLFDVPFVGVVPAIKPAASISKTQRIGLLATPATIVRPYTNQLIADYARSCDVVKVGSSELVFEAEKLLNGEVVGADIVDSVLTPFKNTSAGQRNVDTVVLGCTHFPLLKEQLSTCLPNINWVDSGDAIANRVTHLLENQYSDNLRPLDKVIEEHQLYFSMPIDHPLEFSIALNRLGFKSFKLHYLDSI